MAASFPEEESTSDDSSDSGSTMSSQGTTASFNSFSSTAASDTSATTLASSVTVVSDWSATSFSSSPYSYSNNDGGSTVSITTASAYTSRFGSVGSTTNASFMDLRDFLDSFDVFLLDLDGTLINTDAIVFESARDVLREDGVSMDLKCEEYHALIETKGEWKSYVYERYQDDLGREPPPLGLIHKRRNRLFAQRMRSGEGLKLKEGVAELLEALAEQKKKRAVVTMSSHREALQAKYFFPELRSIPLWITRDDVSRSKPDPECYNLAIKAMACEGERIVGIEDSAQGLLAIQATKKMYAVLVSKVPRPSWAPLQRPNTINVGSIGEL